jgi:Entner-Doudoroff aldolase
MQGILETLGHLGVVPVVKIERADDAVPLGNALIAGGLPCAEITFRTDAAEEAIRQIATELPQIVIGAGTVLSVEHAEKAVAAGARYIVSPGFDPKVVGWCLTHAVAVTPGGCHADRDQHGTRQRAEHPKVLPSRGPRRLQNAQSPRRTIRRRQVHSHWGHQLQKPSRLSEPASSARLWRQLAGCEQADLCR